MKKKVAIVGCGPSGAICGLTASENHENEVIFFEQNSPLATLLPTGGGRCNLGFDEDDIKALVSNYPRGEKFLYSLFSRFSTQDTKDFFKAIGVETYVQDDLRIFPVSNSSSDVRKRLLQQLQKKKITIKNEKLNKVERIGKKFLLNGKYEFDALVISTGGRGNGFDMVKILGHSISTPAQSLVSLSIQENWVYELSGVSLKNVLVKASADSGLVCEQKGDLLFTHNSISGPVIYKVSAYCAYEKFPLKLELNLVGLQKPEFETHFLLKLNENGKKQVSNILNTFIPNALADKFLTNLNIHRDLRACELNKADRAKLVEACCSLSLMATAKSKTGEIVTAGGVNLNEIDPKTMQSKLVKGLYFCGEVVDVDGLCGGFNLQYCWSSGFIVGSTLQTVW